MQYTDNACHDQPAQSAQIEQGFCCQRTESVNVVIYVHYENTPIQIH